jgi:hypothetical protein
VKDSPNSKNSFSAEILKDAGHLSKIVALQPFGGTEVESDISGNTELSPTQVKLICTHQIFIVLQVAIKFEEYPSLTSLCSCII